MMAARVEAFSKDGDVLEEANEHVDNAEVREPPDCSDADEILQDM